MWTRMRTMCTSHSNFGIVVCCCANSGKATEHRWKNNSGFSCNRERQQKQWHTHWNRFCSALDFCSCLSLSCVGVWSSEPLTDTWLNLPLCLFFSFFRQNIHQKTHLRDKFAYDKRPFCCLLLRAIFFFSSVCHFYSSPVFPYFSFTLNVWLLQRCAAAEHSLEFVQNLVEHFRQHTALLFGTGADACFDFLWSTNSGKTTTKWYWEWKCIFKWYENTRTDWVVQAAVDSILAYVAIRDSWWKVCWKRFCLPEQLSATCWVIQLPSVYCSIQSSKIAHIQCEIWFGIEHSCCEEK